MTRKPKARKLYTKKEKEKRVQKPDGEPKENVSDFDFGGLPPRDLKKNLGCG